jgi:ATP-dependent exoDNAse (exonuclease V) alpha subunit
MVENVKRPLRDPAQTAVDHVVLSEGQCDALEAAVAGDSIFITGPGGTGKSVLVEHIIAALRKAGKEVAVAASTGVAAIRVGGCTIHSWLGTQIKKNKAELAKTVSEHRIKDIRRIEQRLRDCQVLIVDEVSMLSGDYVEMMDFWLRRVRRVITKPFGGLQVIFTGDFLQLPPVKKRGEHFEYDYGFQAPAWKKADLKVHALTKVFRQDDQEFVDMLMRLRVGDLDPLVFAYFNSRCGAELYVDPTRLYARNDTVHSVNFRELRKLPGRQYTYDCELEGEDEWAEKLARDCIADPFVELKLGAPVLFLYNNYEVGYVNGERGTVVECRRGFVKIEKADGRVVPVDPVSWTIKDADDETRATMRQLPIKLAWAMTIHKSQGMTLDALECDVSECFAPGQTYVALSRVRSYEGLSLTEPMESKHVRVDKEIVAFCQSVEG